MGTHSFRPLPTLHVTAQKPEQFVNNGLEVQFFRGETREAVGQVEAHLVAKDGQGAGARAVLLFGPFVENVLDEVEVLSHTVLNEGRYRVALQRGRANQFRECL